MPDEPTTPDASHDPPPDAPERPAAPDALAGPDGPAPGPIPGPAPSRVQPRGRDIGLGAIAFAATLVLLLGATGLLERGGATAAPSVPSPPSPGPASNPPSTSARASPSSSQSSPTSSPDPGASASPTEAPTSAPVLVGAGDIGDCGPRRRGHRDPPRVDRGHGLHGRRQRLRTRAAEDFRDCYEPGWGRPRERTRPAPATTTGARPDAGRLLRAYFGDAAAGPGGQLVVLVRPRARGT